MKGILMIKIAGMLTTLLFIHLGLTAPVNASTLPPWEDVKIDVASQGENMFSRSITGFRYEGKAPPKFITYKKINGDATSNDLVSDFDALHISGHLKTDVIMNGQPELVVAGDVEENVFIEANGVAEIYVGGDFKGNISSTGSLTLVVKGDFTGKLIAGFPATSIRVEGDYVGNIDRQSSRGGLLYVYVDGFVSKQAINEMAAHQFTSLEVRTDNSDLPKGIHHKGSAVIVVRNEQND